MLVTTNTAVGTGVAATCGFCQVASTNSRTVMGVIKIYTDYFNTLNVNSISTFESVAGTLIHETLHCLGFSGSAFSYYVNPKTNVLLGVTNVKSTGTLRGKTVNYIILPNVL